MYVRSSITDHYNILFRNWGRRSSALKVLCGNFLDGKFHLDGTLERSFFRVASLSVLGKTTDKLRKTCDIYVRKTRFNGIDFGHFVLVKKIIIIL